MANLGTFDFKKLSVIFGVAEIIGYADGDAVEISEENPAFNSIGGADGFVDRVKNNVNFLTITLRIRQNAPINQILSGLHAVDRAGSQPLPLLIKDRSGTSLITAAECWIEKFPTIVYGNDVQQREWTLKTGSSYVINLAGSNL